MSRHYLVYWRWDTIQYHVALFFSDDDSIPDDDFIVNFAIGDQLRKVNIGDVLWIMSVEPESGDLVLFGKIQVGWCGETAELARRLERDNLWEAGWSVEAQKGTEEHFELIPLLAEVSNLRFESQTGRDRLTLKDGRVSPQQLQTVRLLTKESSDTLNAIWNNPEPAYERVREATRSGATGFLYNLLKVIDDYDAEQLEDKDNDHAEEALLTTEDVLEFHDVIEDEIAHAEGQPVLRTRQERKRNQAVVNKAKKAFKLKHGRLYCEVCGFDFVAVYGTEYIEAHHVMPMAASAEERQTTTGDLVMLCSNCHRIIHSRKPPLSIDELKRIMAARRS